MQAYPLHAYARSPESTAPSAGRADSNAQQNRRIVEYMKAVPRFTSSPSPTIENCIPFFPPPSAVQASRLPRQLILRKKKKNYIILQSGKQ
jgi:hypothetical protein